MADERDPIQEAAGDRPELQGVVTWTPQTPLDRLAVGLHRLVLAAFRTILVLLAVLILLAQLLLGGLAVVADPVVGGLVVLSVVPALAIAGYIWYIDVTEREPLSLLVATFLLGVLFAGFAALINTIAMAVGLSIVPLFGGADMAATAVGMILFFFLIVGPVEEAVKLLAVWLYAYRSPQFDAVVNGAVYGAMAGLGFATIENALYIAEGLGSDIGGVSVIRPAGEIAATRALAGPGHVLYSAIAGYYLGMAKFNPDRAGPIVVKGILIAAILHALYNTLVSAVPEMVAAVSPVSPGIGLLGFVIAYLVLVGGFLYRRLAAYANLYRKVGLTRGD